ncbi:hypothetical protein OPV22_010246 [Ensete ventricosum]|uniref:Uncharacterized protein n=1 Tax=Ensete ventricosum TaxID=4639 RepID=A0AAV8RIS8_ENSVE|nr:hypothetical protein OPV22_010246 [Ensete ventricosum]
MGSLVNANEERRGAEIIYGAEECCRHSVKMLEELGFPKGVLPLKNLQECGWVQQTGFVWMKQKVPYEHFFAGTKTRCGTTPSGEKIYFKSAVGIGRSFPSSAFVDEEQTEGEADA